MALDILGSASFPANENRGAFCFSFFFMSRTSIFEGVCNASTGILSIKFCVEAAICPHYWKLGFLHSPEFVCSWTISAGILLSRCQHDVV